jgi:lysophospholipase L1-like esterase
VTVARRRIAVTGAVLVVLAGLGAVLLVRGGGSRESGRPVTSASVSPPSAARSAPPEVVFLGDSWTVGWGATGSRGYAPLAAERLGWEYDLLGVNGSGYLAHGVGGAYAERVDAAAARAPDLVVVQGSLNDSLADLGQLDQAAADTVRRLREAAGDGTAILVVGAPSTPWTAPDVVERINAGIAAAADAAGVTFVDPARENWTDPAEPGIWADELHPNDVGHQRIADALVPLMRASLERRAGPVTR